MDAPADHIPRFWAEFVDATGMDGPYTAWAFGSPATPALSDKLAQLVRYGPKRATASLLGDYEREGEPLPQVDDLSVVLDSRGAPVCVIRTTDVTVRPFGEVDAVFARAEGEGDLSLAYWRTAHLRFWAGEEESVDDSTLVVCESFDLVWPVGPPAR